MIDESFFNEIAFFRKKWRVKGDRNSCLERQVNPRLNAFAAIDSNGRFYLSMT